MPRKSHVLLNGPTQLHRHCHIGRLAIDQLHPLQLFFFFFFFLIIYISLDLSNNTPPPLPPDPTLHKDKRQKVARLRNTLSVSHSRALELSITPLKEVNEAK